MENFIQIYIDINIFIIGTLFGSFFSLATYRIPRKQDILVTRSYCPVCKHNLGFFDLFPVLSYIIRGGKCKYCGNRISPRYILLEISNGLVFLILYNIFGLTSYFIIILFIYITAFLIIGSIIMGKKMTITEKEQSRKSGVFVVELIIAFIIFTMFMISATITAKNYNNKTNDALARSNAVNIAVNNMEKAQATDYDKLSSSEDSQTINGITYNIDIGVYKYSDEYPDKKDLVSTVEVNIKYVYNGKNQNFKVSALKERKI